MIFKAFFTNSAGIFLSRILGFIRDLLTASILGANIFSDIFFIAFKLPNLFRRIFAEGAFTQSFLPSFARSKNKSIFSTQILSFFFLFLLLSSFIVTIFSGFFAKAIALGFDEKTVDLASPLVAINFYYLPLIFIVTFLGALLQYKNHFATTAFSTALLNIALIIALLLSQNMDRKTIVYAMSYGVIAGGVLQVLIHIVVIRYKKLDRLLRYGASNFQAKEDKVKTERKTFFRQFFHAILGNSTPQISAFLDTWIASFLLTGSISYLYYANRVFQLPLALFAIALSVGIFPKISRLIKNNDTKSAQFYFEKGFWILLTLLGFASITGIILAQEIISLLFQRGAFSQNDTTVSAKVLQMYLIGLIPFGLTKLFSLWLFATQQQKKAAKISLITLLANVVLYLFLVKPLGVQGLALASSCAGFVLLILTLHAFGKNAILAIISAKKSAILFILLGVYALLLLWLKEILHAYI